MSEVYPQPSAEAAGTAFSLDETQQIDFNSTTTQQSSSFQLSFSKIRLDKWKRAAGALQTIFVTWISSGHLLVLKKGVDWYASCLKRTCICLDTTRCLYVIGHQRDNVCEVDSFCQYSKCAVLMTHSVLKHGARFYTENMRWTCALILWGEACAMMRRKICS